MLKELFSEIPEIAERVEQDADALDEIESDRNEQAEKLRAILDKFKDFNLTETSFTWKNRTYTISSISHITFFRSITTHKTNFVETGKTERALLTLALNNAQSVEISMDEQGFLWNKNLAKQIQTLTEFYGFLMHVTFDRRLKHYEDQIESSGILGVRRVLFLSGEEDRFS